MLSPIICQALRVFHFMFHNLNHILSLYLYNIFKLNHFNFPEELQDTNFIFICTVAWNRNDFQPT